MSHLPFPGSSGWAAKSLVVIIVGSQIPGQRPHDFRGGPNPLLHLSHL